MQAADVAAPILGEYLPAEQATHVNESLAPNVAENRPPLQGTHTVDAVAPVAVEYVPETHKVQPAKPTVAL